MRTISVALLPAIFLSVGACSTRSASADDNGTVSAESAPPQPCTPLETRPPNATGQQPAFPGQTRTCGVKSNVDFDVTVVATGIAKPWSVEPLPDGAFLVTEKAGNLRVVSATGQLGTPITGVPPVDSRGQGGLLDVALSPQFANDRTIYWSFTEPRDGGNATSVARGVLSPDRTRLDDVRVILRTMPTYNGTMHYGSRVLVGPDGNLYVTLGERSITAMRPQAQQLGSHLGKILRVRPDGSAPPDNPFVGQSGALPEIWSLGHRNVQAAAFDAQGRLWDIEHGTRGGDELNLVQKGRNYGWPIVAYGVEYNRQPIATAVTQREGTEQPTYFWDPVIAPSGAQFYTGTAFPQWRNNLFIGGLGGQRLVRLTIGNNNRVTSEEHLLVDRARRIRDVRQGPDGALYVVTDYDNGELWKIAPRR
jgi:aldose sugar dehydrogenase